jgi:hypothetical protein
LFIDTEHNYQQVTAELNLHADKVSTYIIFHDTATFADLRSGVYDWLFKHPEWKLKEEYTNNNGLTIFERS